MRSLHLELMAVAIAGAALTACGADESSGWREVASTNVPREGSSPIPLLDGRLLIVSGHRLAPFRAPLELDAPVASAEVYDPVADAWTPTPPMSRGHFRAGVAALDDGRVLVAGGWDPGPTEITEIYDPSIDAWRVVAPMAEARQDFPVVRLPNGLWMAAGGFDWVTESATVLVEAFDPVSETWAPLPDLPAPRSHDHADVRGARAVLFDSESAAVFDHATATWSEVRWEPLGFAGPIVRLHDGRFLMAGGRSTDDVETARAVTLDPWTGEASETGSMLDARSLHQLTLLADGRVLATGGSSTRSAILTSAEVWDPVTGVWSAVPPMGQARQAHTTHRLADGGVLVVGGYAHSPEVQALSRCEVYRPRER